MKIVATLALAAILATVAIGDDSKPEAKSTPDFASMDKAVLVVMCEQFWNRITLLEEKIESLENRIAVDAGATGASRATVGDSMTVIEEGSWVVKILTNPEPNITPLQDKIQAEQEKLPGIDGRLAQANKALSGLVARGPYHKEDNRNGYRKSSRSTLRRNVQKIEKERSTVDRKIASAERQIAAMQSQRTVMGITQDGKNAKIIAKGVYYSMGASLEINQTYTITGRGNVTDSSVTVYVKTATPVAD